MPLQVNNPSYCFYVLKLPLNNTESFLTVGTYLQNDMMAKLELMIFFGNFRKRNVYLIFGFRGSKMCNWKVYIKHAHQLTTKRSIALWYQDQIQNFQKIIYEQVFWVIFRCLNLNFVMSIWWSLSGFSELTVRCLLKTIWWSVSGFSELTLKCIYWRPFGDLCRAFQSLL